MSRRNLSLGLLLMVSLHIPGSWAAPFPGGPSTRLASALKTIPFYGKGFSISSDGTSWKWIESEKSTDETLDISYRLEGEEVNLQPSLRLTASDLSKSISVEDYGKQFISEYSSLGFQVLGTQPFSQKGAKGLVVDLFHRRSNKKLRQVFFIREKTVVQITCQQDTNKFSKVLDQCNRWIKNFTWLEKNQQKSF